MEASLTNDALAEAAPLDCGVKLMVNETLLPAARVTGSERPLTANSEVLILAAVIVMLEPLAVREVGKDLVCPTVTLPKFKAPGLTAS